MNLKEVKEYTEKLLTSYFKPKVLKKFDEDTDGNPTYDGDLISAKVSPLPNNAVENIKDTTTPANNGLYVKDLQEDLDRLNIAQKTINEEMESIYCRPPAKWVTTSTPAPQKLPISKISGNMEVVANTIKLHEGHRYNIEAVISYMKNENKESSVNWQIKDITNNVVIGTIHPQQSNVIYEYAHTGFMQYTAPTDCEIALVCAAVYQADEVDPVLTHITVTEISRVITIDPVDYVDDASGIQDAPVGHIMSFMGINAPKHYLACDGNTNLLIADYPHLAKFFEDEFGSKNYFGGDGITTFGVPDLRGEFLRGAGTATRNTGTGLDVGTHQDATRIKSGVWGTGSVTTEPRLFQYGGQGQHIATNPDTSILSPTTSGRIAYTSSKRTAENYNGISEYTTRPTNTSVLWCIKCEPTYCMSGYEIIDEILDTPKLFNTTGELLQDVPLLKSIEDYDYIEFEHCLPYNGIDLCIKTDRIKVSSIVYNTSNSSPSPNPYWANTITLTNIEPNNFMTVLEVGFRNATTLYIGRNTFNKPIASNSFNGTKIRAIRGIKNYRNT